MNPAIRKKAAEYEDYVIRLRRHFRMHPETGGQEFATQQKIIEELRLMGLEPRAAAGTGVIADLKSCRPGKTVAIRADIDALPINDEIDKEYRSQNPGICHACGHDGHTAILLGAAKVLTSLKDCLPGHVRFLFQPSEERFPGGALPLIADGAMDGVDAVIGAHLWQPLRAGAVGISYGALMASPDEFTITINGKGGHGSMPHQTVSPLLVGAQIIMALQTITGTSVNALEPSVLSLGMFKAGEVFNIIPDSAVMKGTVRTFDQNVRDKIFQRIDAICRGVTEAAGADYVLDKTYGFPPVVNAPAIAKAAAEAAKEILGEEAVLEVQPSMVGEDFSYYQQKAPGNFLLIGIGNTDKGMIYPHHHPKFDMDETALRHGVEILSLAALKLMA